jgi:hypothetical protein
LRAVGLFAGPTGQIGLVFGIATANLA